MSARLDSLLLAVLALLWCAKSVAGNECPSDDPAYPNAYKPLGQLTFYWKMDATTLNGKLVYDGTGYIAVGPSPNAKMSGGEVVLGLPNSGTVKKYSLTGYSSSSVEEMPSSQQTLTNTAISLSGGQTTMTFTKLLSEPGELEISSTGATTLIFAVGESSSLTYHKSRKSVKIDLANCGDKVETTETKALNKFGVFGHAFLMIGAMLYVLPCGILSAVFKEKLGPAWIKIHLPMQMLGSGAVLCGLVVIISCLSQADRDPDFETSTAFGIHTVLGFIAIVFVAVQVAGGLLRARKPSGGEPAHWTRSAFELIHRSVGHVAIVIGILAVLSGIEHAYDLSLIASKTPYQLAAFVAIGFYALALALALVIKFVLVPVDKPEGPL